MGDSRLTALQAELLEAFFRREQRFYLTGGAALAGFHLAHRETHDLDLFTREAAVLEGAAALREAARELGAVCEDLRSAPEFRRLLVKRGSESVVVDLVVERVEQVRPEKLRFGLVRVDPAEEIFANKLCALLGRCESRDLVDLRALEARGLSLADGLAAGARKDGGLTAAQLAWVLSGWSIPEGPSLGVPAGELRAYHADLVARLSRLAHPEPRG